MVHPYDSWNSLAAWSIQLGQQQEYRQYSDRAQKKAHETFPPLSRQINAVLHRLTKNVRKDNEKSTELLVRLFLKHGADPTAKDEVGRTVLHYLTKNIDNDNQEGVVALIQLFLENGADLTAQDEDGWTAMHYFARNLYRGTHGAPFSFDGFDYDKDQRPENMDRSASNPMIRDNEGTLPIEYFKYLELFDPTCVFLLFQCVFQDCIECNASGHFVLAL